MKGHVTKKFMGALNLSKGNPVNFRHTRNDEGEWLVIEQFDSEGMPKQVRIPVTDLHEMAATVKELAEYFMPSAPVEVPPEQLSLFP